MYVTIQTLKDQVKRNKTLQKSNFRKDFSWLWYKILIDFFSWGRTLPKTRQGWVRGMKGIPKGELHTLYFLLDIIL